MWNSIKNIFNPKCNCEYKQLRIDIRELTCEVERLIFKIESNVTSKDLDDLIRKIRNIYNKPNNKGD